MSTAIKNKKPESVSPPATEQDFPIVGIGASAGGLDAFKRFLKAVPEDSGMAYVLVQHLDPSHESLLPEILARVTKIPVNEITEDIHLAPDHIYVIPSNKTLTSIDGVLKLAPRSGIKTNLAIDVFFKSLAEVHQSLAAGVVLSGTASDGTLGLKAIKAHGGITFAQDQQSAAYGDMPQNAVNAEVVDFVLPPEEIPGKLLQIMHTFKKGRGSEEDIPKDDEAAYKQIILVLSKLRGVDFTYYKQTTIRRRITRRMAINKKEKLVEYLKFLRNDKAEQDALFQDVLIPVTSFFRDPKTFQAVTETVFPALLKNKSTGNTIRIWVAGCSTGEEVYSLTIALHEFLGKNLPGMQIQIFASDISEPAITKARSGIYHKSELENVSDTILKKYFTKNNGGYQVNRQVRDMCVFAIHNFLKDPPFAKMDLISCRNVLIYMDSFLQKKALTTFHYALKDSGFLLLGKSETTGPASELFVPFAKNDKIYSRKAVPGRFMHVSTERKEEELTVKDKKIPRVEVQQTDFRKSAESILLSKYTPAAVIINEQMDIVHIHGNINPFLEAPQGKPTFNLIKMAREGLAFELRNTLHKVKTSRAPAIKELIQVKSYGKAQQVSIEIIPLANIVEPHYLILFTKPLLPDKKEKTNGKSSEKINYDENLQRIEQLEKELAQTHEDMRSITEDQEAVNEELQSANEELLSGSEELQSLNEELETSKEELQSTNEELIIINQELLDKQEQINVSRLYTEAIVATIREPLVVLDQALCIKSINTSFSKKFSITEHEAEGKPIYEIQNHLFDNTALRPMLEKVLTQRTEFSDYEIQINLQPFGECTMLLNARHVINEKNKEQLILLAIDDITERKTSEQKLKSFSEELEAKVKERTGDLLQTNMQLQQFAYVASHDLQEPLRKIFTFTSRLQEKHKGEFSAPAKTLLNKVGGASERMRNLIQDLLNYSRLINHENQFVPTDLNETLKNILNDFELLIEQKKAKIKSDKLPVISAIPLQMNQLFYNLISNALKYSKDEVPPVITITSRMLSKKEIEKHPAINARVSEAVKYCEIIFKDNGIGFEQKYGEQIFTIFQRLHNKETYSGTGIGLALSKKIVENHHGEIFAESKENEVAAFHVILPVKQPNNL
ncbi:MAG: CheR family methyltransferase [Bacteroidia bacterium]